MVDDEKALGQMTGAEHYAEAQRLLARSESLVKELAATRQVSAMEALAVRSSVLAEVQAHATLALAAATAWAGVIQGAAVATTPQGGQIVADADATWTKAGAW